MRYKLATVVILASALPLFAADPPPASPLAKRSATQAAPLPKAEAPTNTFHALTPEETEKFLASLPPKQRADFLKWMNTVRPRDTCYFIRQANQDLHKPRAVPELVPLAQSGVAPIKNSDVNCLSDSILRKVSRE